MRARAFRPLHSLPLLTVLLLGFAGAALAQRVVIVNGERIGEQTIAALEQAYRVPIQPGRYWYDAFSGLWGVEGGPAVGQIAPALRLGGPLRANASGGGTNVFFNGRELHPQDVALLYRISGVVVPGRYWINAAGVGGVEGGPPMFDLRALAAQRGGGRAWSYSGPGGHSGSDGNCSYYFDPQTGSSVMTGNCN